MSVNSLPKTVARQRRGGDLNPGPSAPESSTLTTQLPRHPNRRYLTKLSQTVSRLCPSDAATYFRTWSRRVWGQWAGSCGSVLGRSSVDPSWPGCVPAAMPTATPRDSCSWTGSTANCCMHSIHTQLLHTTTAAQLLQQTQSYHSGGWRYTQLLQRYQTTQTCSADDEVADEAKGSLTTQAELH